MPRERPNHLALPPNLSHCVIPAPDTQDSKVCRSVVSACPFEVYERCEVWATFLACISLLVLHELPEWIGAVTMYPARIYLQQRHSTILLCWTFPKSLRQWSKNHGCVFIFRHNGIKTNFCSARHLNPFVWVGFRVFIIAYEKEDNPEACYSEGYFRCIPETADCGFREVFFFIVLE